MSIIRGARRGEGGEDSPNRKKIVVENGAIFQSWIKRDRSWKIGEKMAKKSIFHGDFPM